MTAVRRQGGVLLALLLMVLCAATAMARPANAAAGASTLFAGETLAVGQSIVSGGGQYAVVLQSDGNLVEYGNGAALWSTGTAGSGATRLVMQTDGNLVLYRGATTAVWNSKTANSGADHVTLLPESQLVVYTPTGVDKWTSGRHADTLYTPAALGVGQYLESHYGAYQLVLQADGNLAEVSSSGGVRWSSLTSGSGAVHFLLQNGHLYLTNAAGATVWSAGGATYGVRLSIANDGFLSLVDANGYPVWSV